jgi:hypothetical protein
VKTNDHAVAAGHGVDPARWQEAFDGLMARIAGRFTRVEPRRRVGRLVLGLLSDLPRKNCWTIAEWAGDSTPDGMQHLLSRAKWDADQVRDDVRGYVVEHLRDDQAVLVVDETGDVKKGAGMVAGQWGQDFNGVGSLVDHFRWAAGARCGGGVLVGAVADAEGLRLVAVCRLLSLQERGELTAGRRMNTRPTPPPKTLWPLCAAHYHSHWAMKEEMYGCPPPPPHSHQPRSRQSRTAAAL